MALSMGRSWRRWVAGAGVVILLLFLSVAMIPVRPFKAVFEARLGRQFGAPVRIGTVERAQWFAFTPDIVVTNLVVAQPAWAGRGEMVHIRSLRLTVPLLPVLIGRGLDVSAAIIDGARFNLVRDANGRANWRGERKPKHGGGPGSGLQTLTVRDSSFTLADAKRFLRLSGTLSADTGGFIRPRDRPLPRQPRHADGDRAAHRRHRAARPLALRARHALAPAYPVGQGHDGGRAQ